MTTPLQTGTEFTGTALTATLTPDGRVIVAFLLRLFHLDENDAEHVNLVITLLKAHEDVE